MRLLLVSGISMMLSIVPLLAFSQYSINTVPQHLELNDFYKKYVNVNGIHIISSHKVPDEAVFAACRTIDFMTSSLPENVLQAMVQLILK